MPRIEITKHITTIQVDQLNKLWNEEYPKNLNDRFSILLQDITQFEHHLLFSDTDELIGWAVGFLRDEEIWFSILVSQAHQSKGYGKMLINSLRRSYNELNGWVIDHNNDRKANGKPYKSPMPFYLKNDFNIVGEKRIETDLISAVKINWTLIA